ncbi:MAG: retinol dehydrogenase 12 [Candidatus Eremiobacteraeota bacterium]|nr:retinol dehydrogenase 12 [Candidatus Eremiobacteraeota bacterium]
MAGRVCAITGASSGLGYETALALAGMGATVALLCRSPERGELARAQIAAATGNPDLHIIACDHANLDSVRAAAGELLDGFAALHVLVNNAGLMLMQRRITVDGLEETFQVNHLSAFLLTELLRERLVASAPARVITVSSIAHRGARLDFADLQSERLYDGFSVYCRSKLANVLFTYELARRLEGSGVTANTLHPGLVRTGFGHNNGAATRALMVLSQLPPISASARRGARTQVWLAASPDVQAVSGRYFARRRARRSSRPSYDRDAQRRLWEASEMLLAGPLPGISIGQRKGST